MKNKVTQNQSNLYELNIDFATRCPHCDLIPSLKIIYKNGKLMINYECENEHKGNILLEEYLEIFNKNSLSKKNCDECKKIQNEVKDYYFYCPKCNKFICNLCLNKNINGEKKHNLIDFQRYDALCKTHSNYFSYYCLMCKKNICIYCKQKHEFHDLIDFSKFIYSDKEKNKLEEEIKDVESKIANLDILKQEIINRIDNLKKSSVLEMKFYKILMRTYNYEEGLNNLNFNVIQNLKNYRKNFNIQIYDEIYKEGYKFISFFDKYNNNRSNSFINNFKILPNHTNEIHYISKLNDGRLLSCSNDNSLNIYKKNTYDLQLSIKEHSSGLHSITQINDGRIITCSYDKTMKVIKLIGQNKYHVDQVLKVSYYAYKIIELKENELISVSYDKEMRIWKLDNEKKFSCFKKIIFQNNNSDCNLLKLNNNEFVTSAVIDKCIKFWSSDDYSNISAINNLEIIWTAKSLYLLDDDILGVGGNNSGGFYLIKISTHQLIKNIIGPKKIYSINICIDGLFLCSIIDDNDNHNLIKYKFENLNLIKIEEKIKAHNKDIISCVELDDGVIASGGFGDNFSIKLWSN